MSRPTIALLRAAAHQEYGRSCDVRLCSGRGNDRMIVLPDDLQPERDESMGGTWVHAIIWINDETCK